MKKRSLLISILFLSLLCNKLCYAKDYTYIGSQDEKLKQLFFNANDLFIEKKYKEAIKPLEEAKKINPEQMQVIGLLCSCYNGIEDALNLEKIAREGLSIAQKKLDKDNIGRFYHYIAASYHLRGEYNPAIKYFKLALINKPYFTSDYAPLAYCYYQQKKYDEAIEYYIKAENKDMENEVREAKRKDDPVDQHLYNAINYELEDNNASAVKEYRKVLELDPENIIALINIAGISASNNDYNDAITKGEKALALLNKPENNKHLSLYKFLYLNVLSKSYEKLENFDKSTNFAKLYSILESTETAYKAIDDNNSQQALDCLKKALETEVDTKFVPYNYYAIDTIVILLLNLGKFEEAKEYIQKGINICKKENNKEKLAEYTYRVADYYERSNQIEKAIKYYNIAYENTKSPKLKCICMEQSSNSYLALDKLNKALENLEECKKLIENGVEDYFDIESSIIFIKSLIDENSDLMKYSKHLSKGKELFLNVQLNECIDELALALKYLPQKQEAMYILCEALYQTKKYDDLYELAFEGYKISLRNEDFTYFDLFCFMLAKYHYEIKKDYNEAIKFSLNAIKQKPQVDYFCLIANCYSKLGKYDEAIGIYEKCSQIDPQNEQKYKSFQTLCQQEKDKKSD